MKKACDHKLFHLYKMSRVGKSTGEKQICGCLGLGGGSLGGGRRGMAKGEGRVLSRGVEML